MLSRVAESIYWMSRYIERAENVARVIDVNLHLMLDTPSEDDEQWMPLVHTLGDSAAFRDRYDEATQDNVIQFLTFDEVNPNSIVSCLRNARENARQVRDAISSEMWEQVNRFYLMVRAAAAKHDALDSPNIFYNDVKMASHLFGGITDATMSHNEGWHFGQLGRLFERADKTARILDVKYFIVLPGVEYVGTPYDAIQWSALLKSASGFEMYRKKHRAVLPDTVAAFLILDREFPRSMQSCLYKAQWSLHQITGTPISSFRNLAEQRIGRLRAEMDYTTMDEIIAEGMHEYLDRFQGRLNEVGHAVGETFFGYAPMPAAV
ncbi:alpha-E domain-containing protein [Phycisphaerales bacterium AB-hyl4]|uniref:Alpha-E domain-containing protein n=1 Tax=Natronomicrosphaera hydrolytica TaxID=3242702 RepID=A0ABV4U176_9BACT